MAHTSQHNQQSQELQPVLVLGPPLVIQHFERKYCHKFKFLNAWASSLPIDQFLQNQHIDPSSIRAILCDPFERVSAEVLRLLPSLGVVITSSIGTDHIDLAECRRRRVQVANTNETFVEEDVADLAVGLLIDALRKISTGDRYVRSRVDQSEPWNFPLGLKVGGKRVGIVGLGKIGIKVAKRLEAFGCRVMYNSRKEKSSVSYPFYSNVVDLAADSDALVICCSLTEQTHHIVNREVMLALGRGVIVNIGRGSLIDEKELVQCLVEGKIGGAGLDVFENEPNVPEELFALDNVVLSPHNASETFETFQGKCELLDRNLEAFFSNKPLVNPLILDA